MYILVFIIYSLLQCDMPSSNNKINAYLHYTFSSTLGIECRTSGLFLWHLEATRTLLKFLFILWFILAVHGCPTIIWKDNNNNLTITHYLLISILIPAVRYFIQNVPKLSKFIIILFLNLSMLDINLSSQN